MIRRAPMGVIFRSSNCTIGYPYNAPLFSALTVENLKPTKCGVMGLTGSVTRCIPTWEYKSQLYLLDSLLLYTSAKMGCTTKLLLNFPSIKVSNLSDTLRFGEASFRLFPIPGLLISSAGGAVLLPLFPMELLVPLLSLGVKVKILLIPL